MLHCAEWRLKRRPIKSSSRIVSNRQIMTMEQVRVAEWHTHNYDSVVIIHLTTRRCEFRFQMKMIIVDSSTLVGSPYPWNFYVFDFHRNTGLNFSTFITNGLPCFRSSICAGVPEFPTTPTARLQMVASETKKISISDLLFIGNR